METWLDEIELDILNQSYWEHFKASKDLALVYPVSHPKRQLLLNTINDIQKKMDTLKQKIKERG